MQQENKSCHYTCWYVGVVSLVNAAIFLRGMKVVILVINTYKLEIYKNKGVKHIHNLFSALKIILFIGNFTFWVELPNWILHYSAYNRSYIHEGKQSY